MDPIPEAVRTEFRLEPGSAVPIASLINRTFRARREGEPVIVQRMHPAFAPTVMLDIAAVTRHLAGHGLLTPRPLQTSTGEWVCRTEDGFWRAQTYVSGVTLETMDAGWRAASAARLVARAHRALAGLEHEFRHVREGVHDTARFVRRLSEARSTFGPEHPGGPLARAILELAAEIRVDFSGLPRRVGHGDLKISNLIFDAGTGLARCLIDLDTFAPQYLAYELGDALRSWCQVSPDPSDAARPSFCRSYFEAALRAYAEEASEWLEPGELESVAEGLETVSVELSARFCIDAFEDRYFGWDPERYPSRRAHNLARAEEQLAFARAVAADREVLLATARELSNRPSRRAGG